MKKLIFRKINKDTLYLFLLLCLSLGLIVWTIQAVNYLDYVTQDGHGLKTYLLYSVYNFPKIIHRLIPFIFFVSLFLILTCQLGTSDVDSQLLSVQLLSLQFSFVEVTTPPGVSICCKSDLLILFF